MDERRRAQNRDAQRRHRKSISFTKSVKSLTRHCFPQGISTRARLAELATLKARLSTLPGSLETNPIPATTTVASIQTQRVTDSPVPMDADWNDFSNWNEPQAGSPASTGTPVMNQLPVVNLEQQFYSHPAPDDLPRWPMHSAELTSDDFTAGVITPHLRPGSQRSGASHSRFRRGSAQPGKVNHSALHLAAMEGDAVCVRTLLRHKAAVDGVSIHGATPLHACAENGNSSGHVAVVRLLVEYGAEVDARDDNGTTALQVAAANGNDKVLDALAVLGADVNAM